MIRGLGVGLVALVVGAPVAQARVDGSTGWSGSRHSQGVSDAPSAAAQEALRSNWLGIVQASTTPEQVLRSNWLPIVQPSTTAQDVLRSNWIGIAQPRVVADTSPAPTQVVSRSDGFDWGDAGIGAGTVFAVILLAAGGLVGIRGHATA